MWNFCGNYKFFDVRNYFYKEYIGILVDYYVKKREDLIVWTSM